MNFCTTALTVSHAASAIGHSWHQWSMYFDGEEVSSPSEYDTSSVSVGESSRFFLFYIQLAGWTKKTPNGCLLTYELYFFPHSSGGKN